MRSFFSVAFFFSLRDVAQAIASILAGFQTLQQRDSIAA